MKGSPKKKRIEDLPLDVRAEIALKEAVADAIAEHKLRGHPIAIWREGKVVMIPPEEIVVPPRPAGKPGARRIKAVK